MTFHFIVFKIPSFAHVISFSFIPNIRTIDNKVEERKRRQKKDEKNIELPIERERETERERDRQTETERPRKTENIRLSRKAEWEPT